MGLPSAFYSPSSRTIDVKVVTNSAGGVYNTNTSNSIVVLELTPAFPLATAVIAYLLPLFQNYTVNFQRAPLFLDHYK
jgi:hypothetical protein